MSALGTELELNLHLDPIGGLHMSEYDFEVALFVYTNRKVAISKSRVKKVDDDNYLVIVEKEDALKLGRGKINAEITAHIPNSNFSDGYRTEILILCSEETIT